MGLIFRRFLQYETGAASIEYALIASLIALVIITAVTSVGTKLSTEFANLSSNLK